MRISKKSGGQDCRNGKHFVGIGFAYLVAFVDQSEVSLDSTRGLAAGFLRLECGTSF